MQHEARERLGDGVDVSLRVIDDRREKEKKMTNGWTDGRMQEVSLRREREWRE